uniref:fimbrial protein n=1 Tax=Serratia marcescens TaxID=615 RepID=UPI0011E85C28
MLKNHLVISLLFLGSAWAAEPANNIKLNFAGRVNTPSCQIKIDSGDSKDLVFGNVNVSDLRYFNNNELGSDYPAQWTYSKYIASPIFNIEISQCSADQIAADNNGYQ